jgi:hypothetical protein
MILLRYPLALSIAVLSACSLSPFSPDNRVSVSFSPKRGPITKWEDLLNYSPFSSAYLAPLYACVGVNVIGPGIPNAGQGEDDPAEILEDLYNGVSSCTYKGAMSAFVPTAGLNGTIELSVNVPVGPARVVQVAGANPGGSCDFNLDGPTEIFEWGQAITGIFGPTNVPVTAHPDATAGLPQREMKCGGDGLDPNQFPGLIAWYSADTVTPCDGVTAISPWIARTGIFPALSGAPKCFPSVVNNRPAVAVTAPSERLETNTSSVAQYDGITFVIVAKAFGSSGAFLRLYNDAGAWEFRAVHSGSSDYRVEVKAESANFEGVPLVSQIGAAEYRIYSGRWDRSSTAERVFARVDRASATVSQNATAPDNGEQFIAGNPLRLMLGGDGASHYSSSFAEVLVYRYALSTADIDAIVGHFREKYGIPQ